MAKRDHLFRLIAALDAHFASLALASLTVLFALALEGMKPLAIAQAF
jgi:hypothetical protein